MCAGPGVAVYHLPTTKSGATQPYPTTPSATIDGGLLPMSRQNHALEGRVFTDMYELYTEAAEDGRVGDKLIISSGSYAGTYYCKKIFIADFGGIAHRRCSISTEA